MGPLTGMGRSLPSSSVLGQWKSTRLGQPCSELDLGSFILQLLHLPYPSPPQQQLVAYCFFKKKVDFNAVNLSCRAKTRLLVSCEILLLFSQSLMAVTGPNSFPPLASTGSRCGPGPTPPHCAPLKPTCLPHLHTGGMTQGRT